VGHDDIRVGSGSLTPRQLVAAFAALHADVTFVDADGIVRHYSDYRIFTRTPDALGTHVELCHSEASRARVAQLISELATGWRDDAAFIEDKDGRLVHTRYIAVRDGDEYLGCLEVAQWVDEIAPDRQ
jgi:DUF438 domain-containing protein